MGTGLKGTGLFDTLLGVSESKRKLCERNWILYESDCTLSKSYWILARVSYTSVSAGYVRGTTYA